MNSPKFLESFLIHTRDHNSPNNSRTIATSLVFCKHKDGKIMFWNKTQYWWGLTNLHMRLVTWMLHTCFGICTIKESQCFSQAYMCSALSVLLDLGIRKALGDREEHSIAAVLQNELHYMNIWQSAKRRLCKFHRKPWTQQRSLAWT